MYGTMGGISPHTPRKTYLGKSFFLAFREILGQTPLLRNFFLF